MRIFLRLLLPVGVLAALAGVLLPSKAADSEDLDMKQIFRCNAGDSAGVAACDQARDLILTHCTTCHSFVPIVMQQFDRNTLDGLFVRHQSRVTQLSDEQLALIKTYLAVNFNAHYPPPKLPEELLRSWLPY